MRTLLSIVSVVLLTFASEVRAQGVGVGSTLDVEEISGKQVPRVGQVFSAKFLCGTIPHDDANPQVPPAGSPLVPGTYLTAVNIHNPHNFAVKFNKKALITNPQGARRGKVGTLVTEGLGPDEGLEVDCQNIKDLIFGPSSFLPSEPFFKGFVVLILPSPYVQLDVVGVYTSKNVTR